MHSSIKDDEFYKTRQELMDRDMNKTNDYTTKMKNILRCKYTYRLKTVDQQASLHKLRYNLNDEKEEMFRDVYIHVGPVYAKRLIRPYYEQRLINYSKEYYLMKKEERSKITSYNKALNEYLDNLFTEEN